MFTGIITDVGRVSRLRRGRAQNDALELTIATAYDHRTIELGASIACSGVCLTAISVESGAFTVQASAETLACSTLGGWTEGTAINLERALKVGDELGGHIVSGHVDGLSRILDRRPEGDSVRFTFALPEELAPYVASKGPVALGCVIRGETSHYDHICEETARALQDLAIRDGLAIGYGILTVENEAQALVRADPDGRDKGGESVRACLAIVELQRRFSRSEH